MAKMNFKALKELRVGRKLGNLPEDLALWLVYCRLSGRRVTAETVEKVDGRATVAQIENFFGKKYGIKSDLTPGFGIMDLYKIFGIKAPPEKTIVDYLAKLEAKFAKA